LSRSIPRDALNELSSEEFYDSDLRAAKEEQALANLRRALEPYGLVCERVVLGNYRFHKNYQAAIDQKKVADQTVNKNRSAAEAAVKEWERELETTRGVVGQLLATERGKAQQVTLQTERLLRGEEARGRGDRGREGGERPGHHQDEGGDVGRGRPHDGEAPHRRRAQGQAHRSLPDVGLGDQSCSRPT
jgi:hypothetical protein